MLKSMNFKTDRAYARKDAGKNERPMGGGEVGARCVYC